MIGGGIGLPELAIVFAIILLLFGRRLPELGAGLGKGIKNFKKATKEPDAIDVTPGPGEAAEAETPEKSGEKV